MTSNIWECPRPNFFEVFLLLRGREVLVVILLRGLVYVLMCTAPDLLISWELSRLHSVPKYSFPPPQDLTLYFYILPSTLKLVLKRYLQIHIYIICIWLIIEFSTVWLLVVQTAVWLLFWFFGHQILFTSSLP